MDGIGSHWYIIIFGGIIVFNILKALRKRQEPVPTPSSSQNHPYSTDEKDDFWENPASVFQRRQTTHQQMDHQQMQSLSKVNTTVKVEPKRKPENILNEKEEDKNISVAFSNTDDARQAFIYSEIWNRKY